MSQHYSGMYEAFCNAVIEATESKLCRSLSEEEKRNIHNAGSMMMLEAIDRSINNSTQEQAEKELLGLKSWTEEKLDSVITSLPVEISDLLNRELTKAEISGIQKMRDMLLIMKFMDKLEDTSLNNREQILFSTLADLNQSQ